jgi:AcrR family transcriptional regulator
MPYPRFEKLAPRKREQLLDVAAREFAIHGFNEASINHILEQAEMSKGAAYYYFEDKVDLFCTVVRYASDTLRLSQLDVDTAALSQESFWPTFADLHREPLLRAFERPWLFTVINVAGEVSPSVREREPLARLAHQIRALAMRMIHRGQELGLIRTDLPDDLLFAWLHAIDQASDHWLMEQWERLERAEVARISDQTVAAMSRAVVPVRVGEVA